MHKCIADAFSLHSIFSRERRTKVSTKQAITALLICIAKEKIMNPIRMAKSWINYRRTVAELGNLSNHALTDIGITRFDIRNIASRSFR